MFSNTLIIIITISFRAVGVSRCILKFSKADLNRICETIVWRLLLRWEKSTILDSRDVVVYSDSLWVDLIMNGEAGQRICREREKQRQAWYFVKPSLSRRESKTETEKSFWFYNRNDLSKNNTLCQDRAKALELCTGIPSDLQGTRHTVRSLWQNVSHCLF